MDGLKAVPFKNIGFSPASKSLALMQSETPQISAFPSTLNIAEINPAAPLKP
jgi:hypothetical protein